MGKETHQSSSRQVLVPPEIPPPAYQRPQFGNAGGGQVPTDAKREIERVLTKDTCRLQT